MEIGSGLEYIPMSTSFLDTDGGFALTEGESDTDAYALVGRYWTLRAMIASQGPVLEVTPITQRRMAKKLGLSLDELLGFIGHCCDAELFHRGLWEHERVLTSASLQDDWKSGKKRGSLAKKWAKWSLLEGDVPPALAGKVRETSGDCGGFRAIAEDFGQVRETSEDFGTFRAIAEQREEKERELKEKEEEERPSESTSQVESGEVFDNAPVFDNSASPSFEQEPARTEPAPVATGPESPPCACLMQEFEGKAFADAVGGPHRTAYGALQARYESRTHRRDFDVLMAKVATLCPGGCRASPGEVSECHALIAKGIDAHDPSKGTPFALIRKILTEDRG